MERPLFFPLFSMVSGLATAHLAEWFVPSYAFLILVPAAFCLLFFKRKGPFLLALSMILFCSSNLSLKPCILPIHDKSHIATHISDRPVIIEGVVDSRPEATEGGSRLTMMVESVMQGNAIEKTNGRLSLSVMNGMVDLHRGDLIRFSGPVRRIRNLGLPGELDAERRLAYKEILVRSYVKDFSDVILVGRSGNSRMQGTIDGIATHLGKFISSVAYPAESTILRALLLGENGSVPKYLKDAYTKAGVNHILSISGFHMGVVSVFVFLLIISAVKCSESLLLRFNMHRAALFITIPILFFYLVLSGSAPATIRSAIMLTTFIMALAVERESDPINALILAAVIILALSPASLFEISFQLSFLAIWGIIVFTPVAMAPFRNIEGRFAGKIILFFFTTVAAITATIIPVAYYFHRTSATGLLSNFVIVPLLGYGAVVVGFTALPFVYLLPFLAKLLVTLAAFMVKLSNFVVLQLAKMPLLPVFSPSLWDLGIFYLILVAATLIKNLKIRIVSCLALLLVLCLSIFMNSVPEWGKLRVTFLSVGQGESILVNFPSRKNMLIDGGGNSGDSSWDTGERLIAPALWNMGIDKIDYLVLTHPHPDHIKGLKYVAENFKIGEFWTGRMYKEVEEFRELLGIVSARKIPVRTIDAGTSPIDIAGTIIEPLAPVAGSECDDAADYQGLNDQSLVFRLKSGKSGVLFTGDIGREMEDHLLGDPAKLKCTLLKVAHHGSRYSSSEEFLKAASPSIAVISAGHGNAFHLPSPDTIDRLEKLGVRVYRTDLDGSVQVVFDPYGKESPYVSKIGHFH